MGRPLAKRFFGNRNIGTGGNTNNTLDANGNIIGAGGDDGIGGEGFANVTFGASVADQSYGSGAYLDKMPHITGIGAPSLPGGVQAVADVTNVQAVHGVVNARGTGYQIGDIIELNAGTGTKARFRVTKLRVLTATLGSAASSGAFDGTENLVWDSGVDSHWTTPTILTNVSSSGNPNYDIQGWASFSGGVWDGTDGTHAPTTALTITGGDNTPNPTNPTYNTRGSGDLRGKVGGSPVDNNGAGGTVTFTYGIEEVEVVTDHQGDYTAVSSTASAVTNLTVGAVGANATLDVYYGIKTITVTEKGSGYVGTESVTFTAQTGGQNETRATGTIVLTTDAGRQGGGGNAAMNQENAIIIYANVDGTEGSAEIGDIVAQKGSHRYKVKVADGTGVVKLVADASPALNEGYIVATDSGSNEYFVTKITSRKCVISRKSGSTYQFANPSTYPNGQVVKWTLSDPVLNSSVKIQNA